MMVKNAPSRCPFCGDWTDVVRHIMGNMFEMICQSPECERTAVILADDFERIRIPSAELKGFE